ncbi:hypothetical protein [Parashewanella curva]|nr:hypothetical protein [Parashewanella curva]
MYEEHLRVTWLSNSALWDAKKRSICAFNCSFISVIGSAGGADEATDK